MCVFNYSDRDYNELRQGVNVSVVYVNPGKSGEIMYWCWHMDHVGTHKEMHVVRLAFRRERETGNGKVLLLKGSTIFRSILIPNFAPAEMKKN